MLKLTFQQASDKILDAYFKDELEPFDNCRCFIGNIFDNNGSWGYFRNPQNVAPIELIKDALYLIHEYGYTTVDIDQLELRFLNTIYKDVEGEVMEKPWNTAIPEIFETYELTEDETRKKEDAIFHAMEETLELLREVHIAHGELEPDKRSFEKRLLIA